jgi:hypothetical protein
LPSLICHHTRLLQPLLPSAFIIATVKIHLPLPLCCRYFSSATTTVKHSIIPVVIFCRRIMSAVNANAVSLSSRG